MSGRRLAVGNDQVNQEEEKLTGDARSPASYSFNPEETMSKDTDRRAFAIKYLQEKREKEPDQGWAGPTEIGLKLGIGYSQASSAMMSTLKTLVKQGKIEKSKGGKYRWKRGA